MLTRSYSSRYKVNHPNPKEKFGPVKIEQGVFLGCNTVILQGVTVGRGSYVAAGSVAKEDVQPEVLAAGNPVKVKHSLK